MQSLLETALGYLRDVLNDCYGVDLLNVRTVLTDLLDDPAAVEGRAIRLDGGEPTAPGADFAYAERPE